MANCTCAQTTNFLDISINDDTNQKVYLVKDGHSNIKLTGLDLSEQNVNNFIGHSYNAVRLPGGFTIAGSKLLPDVRVSVANKVKRPTDPYILEISPMESGTGLTVWHDGVPVVFCCLKTKHYTNQFRIPVGTSGFANKGEYTGPEQFRPEVQDGTVTVFNNAVDLVVESDGVNAMLMPSGWITHETTLAFLTPFSPKYLVALCKDKTDVSVGLMRIGADGTISVVNPNAYRLYLGDDMDVGPRMLAPRSFEELSIDITPRTTVNGNADIVEEIDDDLPASLENDQQPISYQSMVNNITPGEDICEYFNGGHSHPDEVVRSMERDADRIAMSVVRPDGTVAPVVAFSKIFNGSNSDASAGDSEAQSRACGDPAGASHQAWQPRSSWGPVAADPLPALDSDRTQQEPIDPAIIAGQSLLCDFLSKVVHDMPQQQSADKITTAPEETQQKVDETTTPQTACSRVELLLAICECFVKLTDLVKKSY